MNMFNMNNIKETISGLLVRTGRKGVEKVISGIEELGFFSAPASIKYHNNFEGGLALHSYQVYEIAMKLRESDIAYSDIQEESIVIACLLHDICKADIYRKKNMGFVKDISSFPVGHGEKSVIRLLMMGLDLTDDEILAIRWHMGEHTLRMKDGKPYGNEAECYKYAAKRPLCSLLRNADTISSIQWYPSMWLKDFKHIDIHRSRKKVYEYTQAIVKSGIYISQNGNVVQLGSSPTIAADTRFYLGPIQKQKNENLYDTIIEVKNEDCLKVAYGLVSNGRDDVSVLNLASFAFPGGGVLKGCGAQEEYLFRCSDYYLSLYQYHYEAARQAGLMLNNEFSYPFSKYTGIFSKSVTVFRGCEEEGYPLLDSPWKINFIAVAAERYPFHIDRFIDSDAAVMKEKIRTIFRIAKIHRQRILVLGALGCGAFKNPPKHVAQLFREVLEEVEFSKSFEYIVFAVKCDHNDRQNNNYSVFCEEFTEYD